MPIADIAAVEIELVKKTNALRLQNQIEIVTQNTVLTKAARSYASYLADKGQFSHSADGWSPEERVNLEGYKWCRLSENLSLRNQKQDLAASELAAEIIDGWMNSAKHRANLLEPNVTEIGVGVARASEGPQKFITVQLFARPQSFQYQISIKNTTNSPISYLLGSKEKISSPRMTIRHLVCDPQTVIFNLSSEKKVSARYQAMDNTVFIVSEDKDQNIKVDITHPK